MKSLRDVIYNKIDFRINKLEYIATKYNYYSLYDSLGRLNRCLTTGVCKKLLTGIFL